jgi:hypothetical protein
LLLLFSSPFAVCAALEVQSSAAPQFLSSAGGRSPKLGCSARLRRAFSGSLKTKNKMSRKKTGTVGSLTHEPLDPRNRNRSILEAETVRS